MKVTIEKVDGYWNVTIDDKTADGCGWDEMIGLVASLTMPEKRPCMGYLRTAEQHAEFKRSIAELCKSSDAGVERS